MSFWETYRQKTLKIVIFFVFLILLVSCSNLSNDTQQLVAELCSKTNDDQIIWQHDPDMNKNIFYVSYNDVNYAFVESNCIQYENSNLGKWICLGFVGNGPDGKGEPIFDHLTNLIFEQQKRMAIIEWKKYKQSKIKSEISSNKEMEGK